MHTASPNKYNYLHTLIGENKTDFVQGYRNKLDILQETTPSFQKVTEIDEQQRELTPALHDLAVDDPEYDIAVSTYEKLGKLRNSIGQQVLRSIENLQYDIRAFEDHRMIRLDSDDIQAQELLSRLFDDLSCADDTSAPFSSYTSNTETSWHYASPTDIQNYLQAKPFLETYPGLEHIRDLCINITTNNQPDSSNIKVPTSVLVHAAGFNSWLGRGVDGSREKHPNTPISRHLRSGEKFTSLNTIKNYASTPSDLPPVTRVNVYVQPDGHIFADNDAGDSHRIAAAMLRGYASIEVKEAGVYLLNDNIFNISSLE